MNPDMPAHLATALGSDLLSLCATDPQITPVQSGTTIADPSGGPTLTPAVPPPLPPRRFPRVGLPAPDHGKAGEHSPDGPRPCRGRFWDVSSGPDQSLLLTIDAPSGFPVHEAVDFGPAAGDGR